MVSSLRFQDVQVPSPGLGTMSLSGMYGETDDESSLRLLSRAIEIGCTFWDSAVVYGLGANEELLGRFFRENPGSREKVFLASKCAFEIDFEHKQVTGMSNTAEHIEKYLQESTERLGSAPDLYYLHRRDPKTPLTESIGTLARLKEAGKIRYIGLSEVGENTLREACKIAHIDALQVEYSAFCLDNEQSGLIAAAKDLGVQVVAFSPLGAGFLTGKFNDPDQFKNDIRSEAGRFSAENIQANKKLVEKLETLAAKKGCTSGQLALAWVAAQGAIPIPGTRNLSRLEENFGATNIELSSAELEEIRAVLDQNPVKGGRWGESITSTMGK